MGQYEYDVVVVGAGPNGLSAAIELASHGLSVLVREAGDTVGGSCRSAALTLDGYTHDICSTVHALAICSPAFRRLPLAELGVTFVHPQAPFAHPLDDGTAAVLERSVEQTGESLGKDAAAWKRLFQPFVDRWDDLLPTLLGPPNIPAHPLLAARFGWHALRSARSLVDGNFHSDHARALFAGAAAHSILPLDWQATAAFGLVLTISAHAGGWPVVRGGSQQLADALSKHLRLLGGVIETGSAVNSIAELPPARAVVCDVTPRQLVRLAEGSLPKSYRNKLARFQYGPGVFKIDWALSEPIPWRANGCRRAGTVHLGGTFEEIAASEKSVWLGEHHPYPYVLLVQPTLFDTRRAPAGKHTAWAYCHVPNGSVVNMTQQIEDQVERFAPGFRETILARHTMNCCAMEQHNPNLIGGDITGGANCLWQLFARPVASLSPYRTPTKGLYSCSASTPPGGGVHGMCGYHAAQAVLRDLGSIKQG